MNRIGRNSLILIVFALLIGLAGVGAILAGDDADRRIRVKDRSRIVIIDDDGNRHEEVFEFGDDHPRPYLGVVLDGTVVLRGLRLTTDRRRDRRLAGVRCARSAGLPD